MRRFDGKVALVTGAASGIGRATAIRLAREGAKVACADIQVEGVRATVRAAEALASPTGSEALALGCDVSDPGSVRDGVAQTLSRFGSLDVLCNIAGVLSFAHTHELALEEWNRIISVNLTGTFLACREAIPHLIATRGSIVNMSSTAALRAHAWTAAYSASKGGVHALTIELAVEYGRQGVRTNCVCPGSIRTPMQDAFRLPEGADRTLLKRIMPFTDFAAPEACASTIAFLASDDASHINGTALTVDGGMVA